MDGITDVTEDDQLTLTILPTGSVLLGTSEGAFRFRTVQAFDDALERVDRQRAAHGYRNLTVDMYHARVQSLPSELHSVTDHRNTSGAA